MSLLQINNSKHKIEGSALFNLGFRPFFLGAAVYSIISTVLWVALHRANLKIELGSIPPSLWHAHEMIFGYSMAVIAGFLLTAVMNWTGIQTITGRWLMLLFSLWLAARVTLALGPSFIKLACLFDLSFMVGVLVSVAIPIFKVKQWGQLGILTKLSLMLAGNLIFYLGIFRVLENGAALGVYLGLYLVVGMILTIAGRVLPMFIVNGVDYDVQIKNPKWISLCSMILFVLLLISQLFLQLPVLSCVAASALFVVISFRLILWHTPGIWRKPLLWGLYLALVCIDLGFLLLAFSALGMLSPFIAYHAFAYGGIGLSTLSMMARVTLGHTGRNIRAAPRGTGTALALLALGVIFRVILPIFDLSHYLSWILIAQVLWSSSLLIFIFMYAPMLLRPRVDGAQG